MMTQKKLALAYKKLILLDRDGVLNELIINQEFGTIDSPLNNNEIRVFEWVPLSLKLLNNLNFGLVIVSNQPAAAKGKTTIENLNNVHNRIVSECEKMGGKILFSYICFHKKEDNCNCRKPKTGLFEKVFLDFPNANKKESWIVGDGVTDIEAGKNFGLKTAFLGPKKCDACKIFDINKLNPDFWGDNLHEFSKFIERIS